MSTNTRFYLLCNLAPYPMNKVEEFSLSPVRVGIKFMDRVCPEKWSKSANNNNFLPGL